MLAILEDGRIDESEHQRLLRFFGEFVGVGERKTIEDPLAQVPPTLEGVCAVAPGIRFENSLLGFTSASNRYTRDELADLVQRMGGQFSNTVTRKLDYLIIGADGNPSWAYACYGHEIERCVELRREGLKVLLVHENDFHDAVADAGAV